MKEETKAQNDSPLMVEWNTYKSSKEFINTYHWASSPEHLKDSLWAAFLAGWEAAEQRHKARPNIIRSFASWIIRSDGHDSTSQRRQ